MAEGYIGRFSSAKIGMAGNKMKYPDTVGVCKVRDGEIEALELKPYGQGMIYKNWAAFNSSFSEPCYCPELIIEASPDEQMSYVFSYNDFLQIAKGDKQIAKLIFSQCDWQCPETELLDLLSCQIISCCRKCGRFWMIEDEFDTENMYCPYCRT